jgi:hypothetical protein
MKATLEPVEVSITDTEIGTTSNNDIFVGDVSQITSTPSVNPTEASSGSSQVVQPDIVNVITTAQPKPKPVNLQQQVQSIESESDNKPKPTPKPSATTDQPKTYDGGGTTPDSNIVIKKPKPNYLVYGVVGIIGVLVVYKMFFKSKTQ